MSCSWAQHGGGRSQTPDLSLWSPRLFHYATAPSQLQIESLFNRICLTISDGRQVMLKNMYIRFNGKSEIFSHLKWVNRDSFRAN